MRSDAGFARLAEQFVELNDPNVVLAKELYAHFGLTFYAFGLVEHSLINAIHVHRLYQRFAAGHVRSAKDWEREWDAIEPALHRLTFGQLVGEAKSIPELSDLAGALEAANANRNYFAHRLFRETAEYFQSEDGTKALLVRIAETREKIESLDEVIAVRVDRMLKRMKLPPLDLSKIESLKEAAVARAQDEISSGSPKFGWNP